MIDLSGWIIDDMKLVKLGQPFGELSKQGYYMVGINEQGDMLLIKGKPRPKYCVFHKKTTQNKWGDYVTYSLQKEVSDGLPLDHHMKEVTMFVDQWIRRMVAPKHGFDER